MTTSNQAPKINNDINEAKEALRRKEEFRLRNERIERERKQEEERVAKVVALGVEGQTDGTVTPKQICYLRDTVNWSKWKDSVEEFETLINSGFFKNFSKEYQQKVQTAYQIVEDLNSFVWEY